MIKIMYFLKRNPGLTHDECIRHHREVHVPLILGSYSAENPPPKRYVAYYLDESPDMPYDFLVEQWYEDDDWEKTQTSSRTASSPQKAEDLRLMLDMEGSGTFSATFAQNVIIQEIADPD